MAFCQQYGLRIPILQAPMAGSCPVNLAVAVADAGGMGAMGAFMSSPRMGDTNRGSFQQLQLRGTLDHDGVVRERSDLFGIELIAD